jgi:hypothetical protein
MRIEPLFGNVLHRQMFSGLALLLTLEFPRFLVTRRRTYQSEEIYETGNHSRRAAGDLPGKYKAPASTVTKHGDTIYVSGAPPFDPKTGEILARSELPFGSAGPAPLLPRKINVLSFRAMSRNKVNRAFTLGIAPKLRPAAASAFETEVRRLGLTLEAYATSSKLRLWCEKNRNHYYIPEWLLYANTSR